ncbi:MAG: hypothetical protein ACK4UX_13425, partial [Thiobacillus sp.]
MAHLLELALGEHARCIQGQLLDDAMLLASSGFLQAVEHAGRAGGIRGQGAVQSMHHSMGLRGHRPQH